MVFPVVVLSTKALISASAFPVQNGFCRPFVLRAALLLTRSLTILGAAGVWTDSLFPASQWKCWESDIHSSVFNNIRWFGKGRDDNLTYLKIMVFAIMIFVSVYIFVYVMKNDWLLPPMLRGPLKIMAVPCNDNKPHQAQIWLNNN